MIATTERERIVRRVSPLMVNGIGAVSTVLSGLLIARKLGISAFGLYSVGLVASRFASAAGQVGLGQVCVRIASDRKLDEEKRQLRIRTAIVLSSIFLIAAAIVVAAVVGPILSRVIEHHVEEADFPKFVVRLLLLFAASVPLHGVSTVVGQAWAGKGHPGLAMALQTAIQPVVLLVLLGITPFGWGSTAQTTAAMAVIGSGVSFLIALGSLPWLVGLSPVIDWSHARMLLREGSLLMPAALAQIGSLTFAVITLGIVADSEASGLYSLAASVALPVNVVVAAMAAQLANPLGSALSANEDQEAQQVAVLWARRMLITSLPYVVIMFVFAEPILGLINDDWSRASHVARFLLAGSVLSVAFGPVLLALTLIDRGRQVNRAVMIGLLIGMIGILLFGWLYGAVGAGAATMVQLIVTNVYASSRLYRERGIRTWVIPPRTPAGL